MKFRLKHFDGLPDEYETGRAMKIEARRLAQIAFDEWFKAYQEQKLRQEINIRDYYQKSILEASDGGYRIGYEEGVKAALLGVNKGY